MAKIITLHLSSTHHFMDDGDKIRRREIGKKYSYSPFLFVVFRKVHVHDVLYGPLALRLSGNALRPLSAAIRQLSTSRMTSTKNTLKFI
jgi:hypothetical protein